MIVTVMMVIDGPWWLMMSTGDDWWFMMFKNGEELHMLNNDVLVVESHRRLFRKDF